MVKVQGIRGCEEQDVLVESMMSVTLPAGTQSDNKYLARALTLIDLSPQWVR